jgi:CubicO group peptidase (beta-lactamase class C family)
MCESSLDQLFHAYRGAVPGASAMLLRDGQVQLAAAFGLAELERQTPASPSTNYRLASVSKQFTAMAALLLVADGRLALSDPLARFFADGPPLWRQITLEQLLCHTSGLRDYEDLIPSDQTAQLADRDALALVRPQKDGYHAPGTTFRYSNTAYCLLALIVEQAADRPFAAFLRERIFAPLGMANTLAYAVGGPPIAERAYGYTLAGGAWARTDQSLTSATLGDGGVYSSVSDLARWDAALAEGMLLPAALQERMFAPHSATPEGEHYGLGWFLASRQGRPIAYHTGETTGFRTAIVRRLDARQSAIVLTNRSSPSPLALAYALVE